MPAHRIYVEPFGGAASVLLSKPPAYANVYNDMDDEVVNLFRVLRHPRLGPELKRRLALTPFARVEFDESYGNKRTDLEKARALVVRSFMGFGSNAHNSAQKSGFRANSIRSGTTPALDWKHYPDALDGLIERLKGVVIEHKDARRVIAQNDSLQTLHYVDPPYVHSTRASGHKNGRERDYKYEMTDTDHEALAVQLHQVKGMVMLSGYPCDLYDRLYGDWKRVERRALADGARKRTEVLWFNAAAWERKANRQEELL